MLTANQIDDVWEGTISSEVRSLYFGDLANIYSTRKQWISGISFFLASGAFATMLGKLPVWIPITCSLIVALANAYSVAVGLDSKIRTMAKLHYAWQQIGNDYNRLWNHTYDDDAEAQFEDLQRRQLEISELATTDAPNNTKKLSHWQDVVFKLHRLESA
jgi:hypothetical protein